MGIMAAKRILEGHRALVTGASSGIGEALAVQLAALGSDLLVTGRRKDRLERLASSLESAFGLVNQLMCFLACIVPQELSVLIAGNAMARSILEGPLEDPAASQPREQPLAG